MGVTSLPIFVGDDIEALRGAGRANLGLFTALPFFQRLLRASGFAEEADKAEEGAGGDALSERLPAGAVAASGSRSS